MATSDRSGVILFTQAIKASGQGVLMTIIIATSAAVITGFVVASGSASVRGLGVHA